jgi:hypothetical protein
MDLFGSGLSNGAIGAPAWPELPAEARAALTSLMTQLIVTGMSSHVCSDQRARA